MSDLVKRLRGWPPSIAHNVMQDAAARIEALEARIAKADALADWFDLWLESGDTPEESDPNHLMAAMLALAAYREGSDT